MIRAAATFFAVPRKERGGDKKHAATGAPTLTPSPAAMSRPALTGAAGGTGPMTMAAAISNTMPLKLAARSNRRKHQVGDMAFEVN